MFKYHSIPIDYLRAGRLVVAPMLKAMKSVREVMVIATPA